MPEEDSPLLILMQRLRSLGPPSLAVLLGHLEDFEEYETFLELVRELLPEDEQEIVTQATPGAQIEVFASRFEARYFPLHEFMVGEAEEYSEITRGIPVILLSFEDDDYHDPTEYRPGYQLMTFLLAPPYWSDEGARVAWGEACAGFVPIDLLERVPRGGYPLDEISLRVKGSRYEGLKLWGDSLNWQTENVFLDVTMEELQDLPDWDRETVAELTQQWQQAEVILGKIHELVDWLDEDPPEHFRELLDFLERKKANWGRNLVKLAGQLEMEFFDKRR